jgi:CRP-like cAMP-binding protein
MVLRKEVFEAIVKEYPEIALGISKELSARIRMLHEKVKVHEML